MQANGAQFALHASIQCQTARHAVEQNLSVGTRGAHARCACAAGVDQQIARQHLQHQSAVGNHQIFHGDCRGAAAAVGSQARDAHLHRVHGQPVAFVHIGAGAAGAQRQAVHRGVQRVAARTHPTGCTRLQVQTTGNHIHRVVTVGDRSACDQGHVSIGRRDQAHTNVGAGLHPHIACGGDAALGALSVLNRRHEQRTAAG